LSAVTIVFTGSLNLVLWKRAPSWLGRLEQQVENIAAVFKGDRISNPSYLLTWKRLRGTVTRAVFFVLQPLAGLAHRWLPFRYQQAPLDGHRWHIYDSERQLLSQVGENNARFGKPISQLLAIRVFGSPGRCGRAAINFRIFFQEMTGF